MKKIASLMGASAVIFGALGTHTLSELLGANAINSFKTATMYQLFHAIALIALPNDSKFIWTARFWVVGILLFSGSIYILVLDELIKLNLSILGPITPLGGLTLIAGWCFLWFTFHNKSRL